MCMCMCVCVYVYVYMYMCMCKREYIYARALIKQTYYWSVHRHAHPRAHVFELMTRESEANNSLTSSFCMRASSLHICVPACLRVCVSACLGSVSLLVRRHIAHTQGLLFRQDGVCLNFSWHLQPHRLSMWARTWNGPAAPLYALTQEHMHGLSTCMDWAHALIEHMQQLNCQDKLETVERRSPTRIHIRAIGTDHLKYDY